MDENPLTQLPKDELVRRAKNRQLADKAHQRAVAPWKPGDEPEPWHKPVGPASVRAPWFASKRVAAVLGVVALGLAVLTGVVLMAPAKAEIARPAMQGLPKTLAVESAVPVVLDTPAPVPPGDAAAPSPPEPGGKVSAPAPAASDKEAPRAPETSDIW